MTRKELRRFFKKDCEGDYEKYDDGIEEKGGLTVGEFDYQPDSDVGGTYGLEELMDILVKYGFTVAKDPVAEDLCNYGWVVFPPEKK